MSIMNSKERKARDRGRKQGYVKAIDDFTARLLAELDKTTLEKDGYYLKNIIIPLAEQMKKEV